MANFQDFYCKECTKFAATILIRPTPTHNNTLQVILKISIFWFANPTLLCWLLSRPVSHCRPEINIDSPGEDQRE